MSERREGRRAGWRDGFALGRTHGYYHGRCEAIVAQNPPDTAPAKDIRIMYVKSGKGVPYSPIDQGIIEGFSGLVSSLVVASPKDDIVRLAANIKPDAVIVLDAIGSFPPEKADALRESGVKTAVWFTDDPYYTDVTVPLAPHYDYVFTLEQGCLPLYRSVGCRQVHHLPFALNPRVFCPHRVDLAFRSDICFIGSAFWNRVKFFDRIASYLARRNVVIVGWWWDRLHNYRLLKDRIRLGKWLSPERTASYYFGAKIVINLHRHYDDESINRNSRKVPALSVNPRTFEICGSGGFQLTDMRQDLEQSYTPGRDIAVFGSTDNLIEQIEYYLDHETERQDIALRGLRRTLQEHTYRHRLSRMLETMFG